MNDNHTLILTELLPIGVNNTHDISPLLLRLFPKPLNYSDYEVNEVRKPFIRLLLSMEEEFKHIKIESDINLIGVHENRNQHWFTRAFNVSLTLQGKQFIKERELSESTIEANRSSLETDKVTAKNARIHIYISIATILISIGSTWYSSRATKTNDDLNIRLKSLEEKLVQLERIQHQHNNQKVLFAPNKK